MTLSDKEDSGNLDWEAREKKLAERRKRLRKKRGDGGPGDKQSGDKGDLGTLSWVYLSSHSSLVLEEKTTQVRKFFDFFDKVQAKKVSPQDVISDSEIKSIKGSLRCFMPATLVKEEDREKGKYGSERLDANIDTVTMLVLDIDNYTEASRGKASQVLSDPVTLEDIKRVFAGSAWYFYSSVKYNPEVCLRGRLLVPLEEPIPAGQCRPLHEWANARFKGRLDKKTSNPARIWYMPYNWPSHDRNYMSVRQEGKLFRPKACFYVDPGIADEDRKKKKFNRAVRDPLRILDRDSREAVANIVGAKVVLRGSGLVATGIECPRCKRDEVHFFIDAQTQTDARCNHEGGSCGWRGALSHLLRDVDTSEYNVRPETATKVSTALRLAWKAPVSHSSTDVGRADRLRHYFPDDLRYTPETGWMTWTGAWWDVAEADNASVHRYYNQAIDTAFNESHPMGSEVSLAQQDAEDAHDQGIEGTKTARDVFVRRAVVKARTRRDSEKDMAKCASALAKAAVSAPFRIGEDRLNKHPLLLAFPNGTYDMETGETRPPDPEDYITGGFDFDYDPEETCPVFESTLKLMISQADVRRYFQACVGSSLAHGNISQEFYLLIGAGQNGKSTVMKALSNAMGDYGTTLDSSVLKKNKGVAQNFDLMGLRNKRMAIIPEWTESDTMDEGRMKMLSGGDSIQAAKKGKDAVTFEPSHTMFMVAQHTPRTLAQDRGTWRRLVVIPCKGTITEAERRDSVEIDAALKKEIPGIITWMVEGMRMWRQGVERPEAVILATQGYKDESKHPVELWFDEMCEVKEGAMVSTNSAYISYQNWCRASGSKPIVKNGWTTKMKEMSNRMPGVKREAKRQKITAANGVRMSTYMWLGFTCSDQDNNVISFNFKRDRAGRPPREK